MARGPSGHRVSGFQCDADPRQNRRRLAQNLRIRCTGPVRARDSVPCARSGPAHRIPNLPSDHSGLSCGPLSAPCPESRSRRFRKREGDLRTPRPARLFQLAPNPRPIDQVDLGSFEVLHDEAACREGLIFAAVLVLAPHRDPHMAHRLVRGDGPRPDKALRITDGPKRCEHKRNLALRSGERFLRVPPIFLLGQGKRDMRPLACISTCRVVLHQDPRRTAAAVQKTEGRGPPGLAIGPAGRSLPWLLCRCVACGHCLLRHAE